MRILIACEESQAVCKEFRKLGHEAYSCDTQNCSGGKPEWHIKDDVLLHLNDGWDMMIAFPPCTHLAVSGAAWFEQKRKDGRQQQGIYFFMEMVNAPIPKISIENPVGIMSGLYRKPDQIIHPYYFGDEASKKTCLWLINLPILKHDPKNYSDKGEFIQMPNGSKMQKWYADAWGLPKEERSRIRSKTFPGIAKAMADQWGIGQTVKQRSLEQLKLEL